MFQMSTTLTRSLEVFTRRDKRNLILVTAIQIVMGVIDLIGVALIGVLGALAVNGVQSKLPGDRVSYVLRQLHLENLEFQTQIAVIGALAGGMLIGRTLISIAFTRRTLFFLSKKAADISSRLIDKLLAQNLLFIQNKSSQQHLFAVTSGVGYITVGVVGTTITLISDLSLLSVMSIGLFILDPVIAFSTFGLFLLIGLSLYLLMHQRARRLGTENSVMQVKSNELILEALDTFRELTVRNRKDFYSEKIASGRSALARNSAEMAFMPNVGKYVIETSVVFGALVISGIQFLTQDATHAVGTLSVFLAAGSRIAPAVLRLQQGAIAIKSSLASALPTLELLDALESNKVYESNRSMSTKPKLEFRGDIELKDVNFTYPLSPSYVISGISLHIPPGSSVALVGASGAGKSTLADLILGVLTPNTGTITISNLRPVEAIAQWPGVVGYVPQSIKMIDGSIKENICLGFDVSDFSDEKIWSALSKAKLDAFVRTLPEGLNSMVGESGSRLSGGQRQRLGIARALLTSPRILVLDEATSALDGKTENDITSSLQSLKGEITIVTIAHRLSTVLNSDLVVYLSEGKIKAKGTFSEVEGVVPEFAEQAALMRTPLQD
jgi:ABC-type multidrug transport system fused ATPase/permease subunit